MSLPKKERIILKTDNAEILDFSLYIGLGVIKAYSQVIKHVLWKKLISTFQIFFFTI